MPTKNGKKTSLLPVPPYVYKWLKHRYGYKTCLEVKSRLSPLVYTNVWQVRQYLQNEQSYPCIHVSAYYPSPRSLYSFAMMLKDRFEQEMLSHVQLSVKLGYPAKHALEDFLEMCRIEEEELALSTAYKKWQRAGRRGIPGIQVM